MENNRNDQSGMKNNDPQQNRGGMQGGTGDNARGAEENPQEGAQWDNYQTRELSSEGGGTMQEGDLMNADEASKQQPSHRQDNG